MTRLRVKGQVRMPLDNVAHMYSGRSLRGAGFELSQGAARRYNIEMAGRTKLIGVLIQFFAVEDINGEREDFAEVCLFKDVHTEQVSKLTFIMSYRDTEEVCIRLQDLGPLKVLVKDPRGKGRNFVKYVLDVQDHDWDS